MTSKPHQLPYTTGHDLKKAVQEIVDIGIIRESDLLYASPIVIVKKPDG